MRRRMSGSIDAKRFAGVLFTVTLSMCLLAVTAPSAPAGEADSGRSSNSGAVAPEASADWPTFHNSPDRGGYNAMESLLDVANVDKLTANWSFKTDGEVWSSPAVADGVVYVGSDDNKVYALNALTGNKIWSHGTSGDVRSSPAVSGGIVYVGSDDDKIVAMDILTGSTIWNYGIDGNVGKASPLVAGGKVYIGSLDGNFYAFNAITGTLKWQVNTWNVWGAPAISGNTIYVGSDKAVLYALDADTGQTKWTATLGDRVRSTPSVRNGTVYVGADDYRVYAYNATSGALKWKTSAFPNKGVVRSSPAIWNGTLFVNTGETDPMGSHIYALDAATGSTIWSHTMADYATSSPAVANGVVYTGSFDHQIYAFDAETGDKLWSSGYDEMQGGIPASVAVVDGVVYIGSKDDSVYAFGL